MKIGVPKETKERETRVALTPEVVKSLVSKGYQISIETGAGTGSSFPDEMYLGAGAEVVNDAKSVYTGADVVLKVNAPSSTEIEWMPKGKALISFLCQSRYHCIFHGCHSPDIKGSKNGCPILTK
jgi:NAD(P) transhydrogenase subunit alpha